MKQEAGVRPRTISSHLLLCFLVSTLIPTILITTILCVQFSWNYDRLATEQMAVSHALVADIVAGYCDDLDFLTTVPYYHSYFSSRESIDPSSPDHVSQINAFQSEMRTLMNLTNYAHSDLSDYLIWSDGQYLYRMLRNELWTIYSQPGDVYDQPWYTRAQEADGKLTFTPVPADDLSPDDPIDTTSFFVTRKLRNLRQPDQNSLAIVNLTFHSFDAQLKDLSLLYKSFVVVTNDQGELIYSSKPLTTGALASVLSGDSFRYDGNRWRAISAPLSKYPLTVRTVYSMDDLYTRISFIIAGAVAIYSLGLLIAFDLYRRLNKWVSRSTTALQAVFSKMEEGDLTVSCPPLNVEEFDELGSSLNRMIDKLNEYIKNEYVMTIQQRSFQLAALQSQIQPHFLINTLYCFIALNQLGEKDKLNSGFYELARLLRYVLSKERFTTLGEELDFLSDYLQLHMLRFGDRLTFLVDCPDELRRLIIPRLLLQPLVENAVVHGIEPCEHPCFCRIRVLDQGDRLSILVEDNGVGLDAEEVLRKASQVVIDEARDISKHDKTSVGLYYVRERLKMWSEAATLAIYCNETTRAELLIPKEVLRFEAADR